MNWFSKKSSYKSTLLVLSFFGLSSLIISILFKEGHLLGGGESGAAFYRLERMLKISDSPWLDALLGANIPQAVANLTFFYPLSFLQFIGLPGYFLQALYFLFALFLTLVSMFLFTKEIFPKTGVLTWATASLFYLFNLYSQINIWNRFLLNFMLFYAAVPLFLWIYLRGLRQRTLKYPVALALVSALFSYGFSSPIQVLILWPLLFLISAFWWIKYRRGSDVIRVFSATLAFWVMVNFWWVSQQIYFWYSQTFSQSVSTVFTSSGNLEGLTALSASLGQLHNLFLLKHGIFVTQPIGYPFNWPLVYNHPLSLVVQWTFVLGTLFVAIHKRRNYWVTFLLTLFILGIFLSKGNGLPFGEIFQYFFERIPLLQVFRNPFEKLGILLPLSLSPLVGLAVYEAITFLDKRRRALRFGVLGGVLLYLLLFMGFPFFSGLIFTGSQPPMNNPAVGYQVVVPDYYREADQWLSKQGGEFRFISLPLGGEGIFYAWPKGYVGVEQSAVLFSTPSISYNISLPFYEAIAKSLEELFLRYPDFYKVASIVNAKYVLFRPDLDFKLSGMRDPEKVKQVLEQRVNNPESQLRLASSFGPLELYQFSDDAFLPKIFAAKKIFTTNLPGKLESTLLADMDLGDVFISPRWGQKFSLPNREKGGVIYNSGSFEITGSDFPQFSNRPDIFPYVSHLPNSKLYPIILIKERLEGFLKLSDEGRANWELILLGKRLIEVKKSLETNDLAGAKKALETYTQMLPGVLSRVEVLSRTRTHSGERLWQETRLFETFASHLYLLNVFEESELNDEGFVSNTKESFREVLTKAKILPASDPKATVDFPVKGRKIYQVVVPKAGEYEIALPKTSFFPEAFAVDGGLFVQIDDNLEKREIVVRDNRVSFGTLHLEEGLHEISLNQSSRINLVDVPRNFTLRADTKEEEIQIPINNFDPYSQYQIYFNYWVRYGDGLVVAISHNTDLPPEEKRKNYFFSDRLTTDDYYFDAKDYSHVFNPHPSADTANLILEVKPWNNCKRVFTNDSEKCNNPAFRELYNRPTEVVIKDLVVSPRFPRELFLLSEETSFVSRPGSVTFEKIDPTRYRVEIHDAEEPFLLVFSELYDSEWGATIMEDGQEYEERLFGSSGEAIPEENHLLVNGYANAWWVERTGDFELVLDFKPQRLFRNGLYISGFSVLGGVFYLALSYLRRRRKTT